MCNVEIFVRFGKVKGVGILMLIFGDLLTSMRWYETSGEYLLTSMRWYETSGERLLTSMRCYEISGERLLTSTRCYETSGNVSTMCLGPKKSTKGPDISCVHPVTLTDTFASPTIISSIILTPVWYATDASSSKLAKHKMTY